MIKKCKVNENHWYSDHLCYCPWCKIANETGKDPFPSSTELQIPVGSQISAPSTVRQSSKPVVTKYGTSQGKNPPAQKPTLTQINTQPKNNATLYKTVFVGITLCFIVLFFAVFIGNALINGNDRYSDNSHTVPGDSPTPTSPIVSNNMDTDSGTIATSEEPVLPVADFWSDTTSGEAPLTIAFTDQSTGSPTSWDWNFGDGVTSTEKNPIHTYKTDGTYTVKETVTSEAGKDTKTKTDYITVTAPTEAPTVAPPDADFSASEILGEAPLTVSFTDESSGSPNAWKWNFGDSSDVLTEYNPTHTYKKAGTYTVTETVTNEAGKDTETKTDYITVTALESDGKKSDYTSYPTKSEVLTFVNDYQGVNDFIETVSIASQSDHPEWKWDIWQDQNEDKISFYYQNNPKGYDSIYFDSKGKITSKHTTSLIRQYP